MTRIQHLQKNLKLYQDRFDTPKEKKLAGDNFADMFGFVKGRCGRIPVVWVDPRQLELFELAPYDSDDGETCTDLVEQDNQDENFIDDYTFDFKSTNDEGELI